MLTSSCNCSLLRIYCCMPPQTWLRCAPLPHTDNVSWVVNILLLVAKGYAWWISGSKAVLASLVDSFVDLVRQTIS